MTREDEVKQAVAIIPASDLRCILQNMALRYPSGFLDMIHGRNEIPVRTGPKVYISIEEFNVNPSLRAGCERVATELLQQGQTISAIKAVREMSGLGLKESKEFVQSLPAYGCWYKE